MPVYTHPPHPGDQKTHGALETDGYDEVIGVVVPHHAAFLATLLEYLPGDAPHILELGGGTGIVTAMIRAARPGAQITCIDLSAEMLAMARQKPELAGVRMVQGDLRDPWPEGLYDAVVTALCLHHVGPDDRAGAAARAAEVLAPGGRFICADVFRPEEDWQEAVIRDHWRSYMAAHGVPDAVAEGMLAGRTESYPAMDTVRGFEERLKRAGFFRVMAPFTAGFLGVVVGFSEKRRMEPRE
ncbi:MAG TPA: class I SAM-dependent methyltransferase [Methanoculleus sp.]|nr:class I SAM-dependent methyltransferase [Methanoculleus sp.]